MAMTWEAFYRNELVGVYSVLVVPVLFLLWLVLGPPPASAGVEPRAARFVRCYAVVFLIETIVDVLVTGPLLGWLGMEASPLADKIMLPFVLLGDFRVLLLVVALATPGRALPRLLAEAAAWTLIVPALTWIVHGGLSAVLGPLPSMTIWLIYETAFAVLALFLRLRVVPARVAGDAVRSYLGAVLNVVIAYYALWATADLLILAGFDLGWALRLIPNQLYYAFWVPFVYLRFFSRRDAGHVASSPPAR